MAGPTWVFDTSSLIAIKSMPRATRPNIQAVLTALVQEGRLRMPKQVVDELRRGKDEVLDWALSVENEAVLESPTLDEVKVVLSVIPDILDPQKDSGADEADPYVLAMAVKLKASGADVRLVTQETRDKSDKTSLNTAAGMLGIPCVPLLGFLRVEGIS
jgi:Domain of unknown function (DUF4411)